MTRFRRPWVLGLQVLLAAVLALAVLSPAALALSTPTVVNLNATEGIATDGATPLATFTDPPGLLGCKSPAAYTAAVNWGDATSSAGVVSAGPAPPPLQPCNYVVMASHTYAVAMPATPFKVTVTSGGASQVGTGSVTVADQALTAGPATTITATAGTPLSATVGSFTDPAPQPPSGYSAAVHWGDGTTTAGTIVADASNANRFTVSAGHTYASAGTYPITVDITDTAGGATTTLNATANVADQPLTAGPATTITATAGTPLSATVGSFTDPAPQPPSGYSAAVHWGDGTTTAGTIVADASNANRFTVSAGHTYASAGTYPITVDITDTAGGATTTLNATANVADQPLTAGPATTITATAGTPLSATVGSFTDPAPQPPSGYSAAVHWGDGTTTAGTIVADASNANRFTVSAGHTYASAGTYPITVDITDTAGGATTTLNATANVADQPLTAGPATTITATAGTPLSATVGSFTDPAPQPPSGYSAAVHWGDGTTTAGTIVADASNANRFTVSAGHTYASAGTYPITVDVTDTAGSTTTTLNATANVAAASHGTGGGGGSPSGGTAPAAPTGSTAPAPAPGASPAAPTAAPAALKPAAFVVLVRSVRARRGTLVVRVNCPATRRLCRGRLVVFRLIGKQPAGSLGSRLFLIGGGETATLDLRLSSSRLRALRRIHKLRVRAVVSAADPGTFATGSGLLDSALKLQRG